MKKIVITLLAVTVLLLIYGLAMQEPKKVQVGDTLEAFTLKDQNGNDFNLGEYLGKHPMVIYFYPKDDTPGCTKEACAFRDSFESFTDMGVKVIGISADSVKSHKDFVEKYKLPFTLLADTNNVIRKRFGVPKSMLGLLPGRVTYVINKSGKVVYIFESQLGAEKHISESLKALKQHM